MNSRRAPRAHRLPILVRLTAVAIIGVFGLQEIAHAAPVITPLAARTDASSAPVVGLPASVALIDDFYSAGPDAPLIVFLQDAHTNPSAQLNIARAVEHLLRDRSVSTVYLEGGKGDVSLTDLRASVSSEARRSVGLSHLKKGLLQGVEYANLTSEAPFSLWGVENRALYERSLRVYRDAAAARERSLTALSRIAAAYTVVRDATFGPELLEWEQADRSYASGEMPAARFAEWIERRLSNLGLPDHFYPKIKSLTKLNANESKLRQDLAHKGMQALARAALEPGGLEDPAERLLVEEFVSGRSGDEARVDAVCDLLLKIRAQREAAAFVPESREAVREAEAFLRHRVRVRELVTAELVNEIEAASEGIARRLASSEDDRRMLEAGKMIGVWKAALELRLDSKGYQLLASAPARLTPAGVHGYLNLRISTLDKYYEKALLRDREFERALASAKSFYELAARRDRVFWGLMRRRMEERGERRAVLVAGGYHAEHLKRIFRSAGVSYASFIPRVTHETDSSKYEKILLSRVRRGTSGPGPVRAAIGTLQVRAAGNTGARLAFENDLRQAARMSVREESETPSEPGPAAAAVNLAGPKKVQRWAEDLFHRAAFVILEFRLKHRRTLPWISVTPETAGMILENRLGRAHAAGRVPWLERQLALWLEKRGNRPYELFRPDYNDDFVIAAVHAARHLNLRSLAPRFEAMLAGPGVVRESDLYYALRQAVRKLDPDAEMGMAEKRVEARSAEPHAGARMAYEDMSDAELASAAERVLTVSAEDPRFEWYQPKIHDIVDFYRRHVRRRTGWGYADSDITTKMVGRGNLIGLLRSWKERSAGPAPRQRRAAAEQIDRPESPDDRDYRTVRTSFSLASDLLEGVPGGEWRIINPVFEEIREHLPAHEVSRRNLVRKTGGRLRIALKIWDEMESSGDALVDRRAAQFARITVLLNEAVQASEEAMMEIDRARDGARMADAEVRLIDIDVPVFSGAALKALRDKSVPIVWILDNSGTMTPSFVDPLTDDMTRKIDALLASSRDSYIVIASGDPLDALKKLYARWLDHPRFLIVAEGGTAVRTQDGQERRLEAWPHETRRAYAKAMVAGLEEILPELAAAAASAADAAPGRRRKTRPDELLKVFQGQLAAAAKKIDAAYVRGEDFDEIPLIQNADTVGVVGFADQRAKVTIHNHSRVMNETLAANLLQAAERHLAAREGTAAAVPLPPYRAYGSGYIDWVQRSKAEGAEAALEEKVLPALRAAGGRALVVSAGDSSNDYPSFALRFRGMSGAVYRSIFLNGDYRHTVHLPKGTVIPLAFKQARASGPDAMREVFDAAARPARANRLKGFVWSSPFETPFFTYRLKARGASGVNPSNLIRAASARLIALRTQLEGLDADQFGGEDWRRIARELRAQAQAMRSEIDWDPDHGTRHRRAAEVRDRVMKHRRSAENSLARKVQAGEWEEVKAAAERLVRLNALLATLQVQVALMFLDPQAADGIPVNGRWSNRHYAALSSLRGASTSLDKMRDAVQLAGLADSERELERAYPVLDTDGRVTWLTLPEAFRIKRVESQDIAEVSENLIEVRSRTQIKFDSTLSRLSDAAAGSDTAAVRRILRQMEDALDARGPMTRLTAANRSGAQAVMAEVRAALLDASGASRAAAKDDPRWADWAGRLKEILGSGYLETFVTVTMDPWAVLRRYTSHMPRAMLTETRRLGGWAGLTALLRSMLEEWDELTASERKYILKSVASMGDWAARGRVEERGRIRSEAARFLLTAIGGRLEPEPGPDAPAGAHHQWFSDAWEAAASWDGELSEGASPKVVLGRMSGVLESILKQVTRRAAAQRRIRGSVRDQAQAVFSELHIQESLNRSTRLLRALDKRLASQKAAERPVDLAALRAEFQKVLDAARGGLDGVRSDRAEVRAMMAPGLVRGIAVLEEADRMLAQHERRARSAQITQGETNTFLKNRVLTRLVTFQQDLLHPHAARVRLDIRDGDTRRTAVLYADPDAEDGKVSLRDLLADQGLDTAAWRVRRSGTAETEAVPAESRFAAAEPVLDFVVTRAGARMSVTAGFGPDFVHPAAVPTLKRGWLGRLGTADWLPASVAERIKGNFHWASTEGLMDPDANRGFVEAAKEALRDVGDDDLVYFSFSRYGPLEGTQYAVRHNLMVLAKRDLLDIGGVDSATIFGPGRLWDEKIRLLLRWEERLSLKGRRVVYEPAIAAVNGVLRPREAASMLDGFMNFFVEKYHGDIMIITVANRAVERALKKRFPDIEKHFKARSPIVETISRLGRSEHSGDVSDVAAPDRAVERVFHAAGPGGERNRQYRFYIRTGDGASAARLAAGSPAAVFLERNAHLPGAGRAAKWIERSGLSADQVDRALRRTRVVSDWIRVRGENEGVFVPGSVTDPNLAYRVRQAVEALDRLSAREYAVLMGLVPSVRTELEPDAIGSQGSIKMLLTLINYSSASLLTIEEDPSDPLAGMTWEQFHADEASREPRRSPAQILKDLSVHAEERLNGRQLRARRGLAEWMVRTAAEQAPVRALGAGVSDLAILSHRDPRALQRALDAYLDNLLRYGHTDVNITVLDDTPEGAVAEENRRITESTLERVTGSAGHWNHRGRIRYVGPREKQEHLAALRAAIDPEGLNAARVTRDLETVFGRNAGGNRNFAMSYFAGRRVVILDSDSAPNVRVARSALTRRASATAAGPLFDLTRSNKPGVHWLGVDSPSEALPVDFLSAMDRLLGRDASDLPDAAVRGLRLTSLNRQVEGPAQDGRIGAAFAVYTGDVDTSAETVLVNSFGERGIWQTIPEDRLEAVGRDILAGQLPVEHALTAPIRAAVVAEALTPGLQTAVDLTDGRFMSPSPPGTGSGGTEWTGALRMEDFAMGAIAGWVQPGHLVAQSAAGASHQRSSSESARSNLTAQVKNEITARRFYEVLKRTAEAWIADGGRKAGSDPERNMLDLADRIEERMEDFRYPSDLLAEHLAPVLSAAQNAQMKLRAPPAGAPASDAEKYQRARTALQPFLDQVSSEFGPELLEIGEGDAEALARYAERTAVKMNEALQKAASGLVLVLRAWPAVTRASRELAAGARMATPKGIANRLRTLYDRGVRTLEDLLSTNAGRKVRDEVASLNHGDFNVGLQVLERALERPLGFPIDGFIRQAQDSAVPASDAPAPMAVQAPPVRITDEDRAASEALRKTLAASEVHRLGFTGGPKPALNRFAQAGYRRAAVYRMGSALKLLGLTSEQAEAYVVRTPGSDVRELWVLGPMPGSDGAVTALFFKLPLDERGFPHASTAALGVDPSKPFFEMTVVMKKLGVIGQAMQDLFTYESLKLSKERAKWTRRDVLWAMRRHADTLELVNLHRRDQDVLGLNVVGWDALAERLKLEDGEKGALMLFRLVRRASTEAGVPAGSGTVEVLAVRVQPDGTLTETAVAKLRVQADRIADVGTQKRITLDNLLALQAGESVWSPEELLKVNSEKAFSYKNRRYYLGHLLSKHTDKLSAGKLTAIRVIGQGDDPRIILSFEHPTRKIPDQVIQLRADGLPAVLPEGTKVKGNSHVVSLLKQQSEMKKAGDRPLFQTTLDLVGERAATEATPIRTESGPIGITSMNRFTVDRMTYEMDSLDRWVVEKGHPQPVVWQVRAELDGEAPHIVISAKGYSDGRIPLQMTVKPASGGGRDKIYFIPTDQPAVPPSKLKSTTVRAQMERHGTMPQLLPAVEPGVEIARELVISDKTRSFYYNDVNYKFESLEIEENGLRADRAVVHEGGDRPRIELHLSVKDGKAEGGYRALEEVQVIDLDPRLRVPIPAVPAAASAAKKYRATLSVLNLLLDQQKLAEDAGPGSGIFATSLVLRNPNDRVRQIDNEGVHALRIYRTNKGLLQLKFSYRLYSMTNFFKFNGFEDGRDRLEVEFENSDQPRLIFRLFMRDKAGEGAAEEGGTYTEMAAQTVHLSRDGNDFWPSVMDGPGEREKDSFTLTEILRRQRDRAAEGFFVSALRLDPIKSLTAEERSGVRESGGPRTAPLEPGEVRPVTLNAAAKTVFFKDVTYNFARFEQDAGILVESAQAVRDDAGTWLVIRFRAPDREEAPPAEVRVNLDPDQLGPAVYPGGGRRMLSLQRVLAAQRAKAAEEPDMDWFVTDLFLGDPASASRPVRPRVAAGLRSRQARAQELTGTLNARRADGGFVFRGVTYFVGRLASKWGVPAESIAARYDLTDPSNPRLVFTAADRPEQTVNLVQAKRGNKTIYYPAVRAQAEGTMSSSFVVLRLLKEQKEDPDGRFFATDIVITEAESTAAPRKPRTPREPGAPREPRAPRAPKEPRAPKVKALKAPKAPRPAKPKKTPVIKVAPAAPLMGFPAYTVRLERYFADAPAALLKENEVWLYVDSSELYAGLRSALRASALAADGAPSGLLAARNKLGLIRKVSMGPRPGVFRVELDPQVNGGFANQNTWIENAGMVRWNKDRHWARLKQASAKTGFWIPNGDYPNLLSGISHLAFYDSTVDQSQSGDEYLVRQDGQPEELKVLRQAAHWIRGHAGESGTIFLAAEGPGSLAVPLVTASPAGEGVDPSRLILNDRSRSMLSLARERIEAAGAAVTDEQFRPGSVLDPAVWPEQPVSLVADSMFVNFLSSEERKAYWNLVRQRLAEGGKLVTVVRSIDLMDARGMLEGLFGSDPRDYEDEHDRVIGDFIRELQEAGWDARLEPATVRVQPDEGELYTQNILAVISAVPVPAAAVSQGARMSEEAFEKDLLDRLTGLGTSRGALEEIGRYLAESSEKAPVREERLIRGLHRALMGPGRDGIRSVEQLSGDPVPYDQWQQFEKIFNSRLNREVLSFLAGDPLAGVAEYRVRRSALRRDILRSLIEDHRFYPSAAREGLLERQLLEGYLRQSGDRRVWIRDFLSSGGAAEASALPEIPLLDAGQTGALDHFVTHSGGHQVHEESLDISSLRPADPDRTVTAGERLRAIRWPDATSVPFRLEQFISRGANVMVVPMAPAPHDRVHRYLEGQEVFIVREARDPSEVTPTAILGRVPPQAYWFRAAGQNAEAYARLLAGAVRDRNGLEDPSGTLILAEPEALRQARAWAAGPSADPERGVLRLLEQVHPVDWVETADGARMSVDDIRTADMILGKLHVPDMTLRRSIANGLAFDGRGPSSASAIVAAVNEEVRGWTASSVGDLMKKAEAMLEDRENQPYLSEDTVAQIRQIVSIYQGPRQPGALAPGSYNYNKLISLMARVVAFRSAGHTVSGASAAADPNAGVSGGWRNAQATAQRVTAELENRLAQYPGNAVTHSIVSGITQSFYGDPADLGADEAMLSYVANTLIRQIEKWRSLDETDPDQSQELIEAAEAVVEGDDIFYVSRNELVTIGSILAAYKRQLDHHRHQRSRRPELQHHLDPGPGKLPLMAPLLKKELIGVLATAYANRFMRHRLDQPVDPPVSKAWTGAEGSALWTADGGSFRMEAFQDRLDLIANAFKLAHGQDIRIYTVHSGRDVLRPDGTVAARDLDRIDIEVVQSVPRDQKYRLNTFPDDLSSNPLFLKKLWELTVEALTGGEYRIPFKSLDALRKDGALSQIVVLSPTFARVVTLRLHQVVFDPGSPFAPAPQFAADDLAPTADQVLSSKAGEYHLYDRSADHEGGTAETLRTLRRQFRISYEKLFARLKAGHPGGVYRGIYLDPAVTPALLHEWVSSGFPEGVQPGSIRARVTNGETLDLDLVPAGARLTSSSADDTDTVDGRALETAWRARLTDFGARLAKAQPASTMSGATAEAAFEIALDRLTWIEMRRDENGRLRVKVFGEERTVDGRPVSQVRPAISVGPSAAFSPAASADTVRVSPEEWADLQRIVIDSAQKKLDLKSLPNAAERGLVVLHLDGLTGSDALRQPRLGSLAAAAARSDRATGILLVGSEAAKSEFAEHFALEQKKLPAGRGLPSLFLEERALDGTEYLSADRTHVMSQSDRLAAGQAPMRAVVVENAGIVDGRHTVQMFAPALREAEAISRLRKIEVGDSGLQSIFDFHRSLIGPGRDGVTLDAYAAFLNEGRAELTVLMTLPAIARVSVGEAVRLFAQAARLARQSA
jgi:hypothetical protein